MKAKSLRKLLVCALMVGWASLAAKPVGAITIVSQSPNVDITLGLSFNDLEFEDPLLGTEKVQGYIIKEWLDADYTAGPPRDYEDWSVNDPANIDGNANEVWMRFNGHMITTSTTVNSTVVSVHMVGDNNDGLAQIMVDGIEVARLDMYTAGAADRALIIVKYLANATHTIDVNDLGQGSGGAGADDVAVMGAAALVRNKWLQKPDRRDTAMNVDGTWIADPVPPGPYPQILADDFYCEMDGPITHIGIWSSWKGDEFPNYEPENVAFVLSIHKDIPAEQSPSGHSIPGELLWWERFEPGQFTVEEAFASPQWWYSPCTEPPEVIDGDHVGCWKYDFYIDVDDPCVFVQEAGNIYWLDVQAFPQTLDPSIRWGWKTRDPCEHFMDDAVWGIGVDPHDVIEWHELRYPPGHPYDPCSIDLAFEIDTTEVEGPKEPVPHLKWSQPPLEVDATYETPEYCGWDEKSGNAEIEVTDPYKWHQPPDLSTLGMDVDATWDNAFPVPTPQIVASDFMCNKTGRITGINIFSSWLYDELPGDPIDPHSVSFMLSIHEDIPAAQNPGGFSMPGKCIWKKTFQFPEFSALVFADQLMEGYFIPCQSMYYWPGDWTCWLYQFNIDPCDAFVQEEGNIYWLDVQAYPQGTTTARWGWKTSDVVQYDDGCWAQGEDPCDVIWHELIHPETQQSVDLAFDIITEPVEQYKIVADDFRCLGTMPVTSVHWWGSYIYWDNMLPPDPDPCYWQIGFWSNIPDPDPLDPLTYSQPDKLLKVLKVDPDRVEIEWVGYDVDVWGAGMMDSCFQYYVDLDPCEYFKQAEYETQDYVFWISIAAIYPQVAVVQNPWGWKTRPWHWMDDAAKVAIPVDVDPQPGMTVSSGQVEPLKDPEGESVDVAFELDTDPCYIKWEQAFTGFRHWAHYEDKESMADITLGDPCIIVFSHLAADDWPCKRRTPVTAICWWGSYLNYEYYPCMYEVMQRPEPPDYFLLRVWTDMPVGDPCNDYSFSHPARVIWEYLTSDYDEVMVGFDKYPELGGVPTPGPREPVFRYSVRLPEEKWFCQREVDGIFWLSITAVYNVNNPPFYAWGWTIHEHVFMDDGVQGYMLADEWVWSEIFDQNGDSADLSYILFTDPDECCNCADFKYDGTVDLGDFLTFVDDWLWKGKAGGYNTADLNCDGKVQLLDFAIFSSQWMGSCP